MTHSGPTVDLRAAASALDPTAGAASLPLQELVGQYHHRLMSLEAELKDQGRARALSPRAFAKRVARLKNVHERLAALQRLSTTAADPSLNGTDIGLPLLDECTPSEREVCAQHLQERLDDAEDAATHSGRVYKWLVEAVTGRAGVLRTTLRLSHLRRLIQAAERETATLQETSKSLSLQVDRLLGGGPRAQSAIEGLMALFHQLDATIARVARLKASVKKEQGTTQAMEAWLRQEEATIRARPVGTLPPSPLTLEGSADDRRPTAPRRVVRRRRLAEAYWQDVVHNGARPPTEKEIRRAVALLGAGRSKETR